MTHPRDQEIKRLINYAKGLNIDVRFLKGSKEEENAGGWSLDGTEIFIVKKNNSSKIELVLTLIHEISHHMEHIHNNNRQIDWKLVEAIQDEEEKKRSRKKIYEFELASGLWWPNIYKETDCKFNINKLYLTKDFDIWMYEVYYLTGEFPTRKEQRIKYKELKKKYL